MANRQTSTPAPASSTNARIALLRPLKSSDPLASLSFVRSRHRAAGGGRCYWVVNATGGYSSDCDLGNELALEFLASEATLPLQWVVNDLPRPLTGIEIGFLSVVGAAASVGRCAGTSYVLRGRRAMADYRAGCAA